MRCDVSRDGSPSSVCRCAARAHRMGTGAGEAYEPSVDPPSAFDTAQADPEPAGGSSLQPEDRTSDAHTLATASGLVLRVTPRKNRIEDEPEKRQAKPESRSFAELLRKIDGDNDSDDDVCQRDEEQQQPPPRLAGDPQVDDAVV